MTFQAISFAGIFVNNGDEPGENGGLLFGNGAEGADGQDGGRARLFFGRGGNSGAGVEGVSNGNGGNGGNSGLAFGNAGDGVAGGDASVLHRLGIMRRYLRRVVLCGALLTLAVAGCSSSEQKPSTSTPPPMTSTSELPPLPAEPAQPGAIGVSPDGVTTQVDVPADATESQYGQACHAAKVWMDGQQTDPKTLIEPYLKVIQAPDFTGPGNFNTPWANLTPAQQAGVIVAVNAAANGECE